MLMGYGYIAVVVIGITTVAWLAKLSARNGVSSFELSFTMFGLAAVFGYPFAMRHHVPASAYSARLWWIAIMAGIGGATAVFIFNRAVRIGHFGFSNAIYRSSFVMPVVFSVLFFGAQLNLLTIAGILAILTAIFLVSWSNEVFAKTADSGNGGMLWFVLILCAFSLSGLPRIGQLLIHRNDLNPSAYLFASYAAGFLTMAIPFAFRGWRIRPLAWLYGGIAAVASFAGVYSTLAALKVLPAFVVFPVTLSAPILLGMFVSLFYRERIRPLGWIGIFLGIGGILTLSLQTYLK